MIPAEREHKEEQSSLIHQASYLLDQQLRQLEKRFLAEGGFTERLYSEQVRIRGRKPH